MELFRLLGTIAIDNQQANNELAETTGKAEDSQDKITGAFKKIGAAVATYFAIEKIAAFGKSCLEAAANAQAMESQFTQVFGDLGESASSSLTAIADSAGIAENRMKGSFTKIASFGKTTGMDTADALELAERAMIAVADSAAFYDRSLEDTTESLQSFLKGNYENDAALGLSCTETTRNAAANALYGKSFQELSEAQKQLTLLKMVEDANALSGALGQAARESSTWTNQTGNLKQAWTDFTAMIGEAFLPAAIKVVEVISSIVEWMTKNGTTIGVLAIGVGTLTAAIIAYNAAQNAANIVTAIATATTTAFGSVMAFITSPITLVIAAIGALVAAGVLLYKNWDEVKAKASELWQKLTEVFNNIKSTIVGVWEGIWSSIKGILNNMLGGVESWINGIINSINRLLSGISSLASSVGSLIGLGNIRIPSISSVALPRLEKGGVLERGQVGFLEGNGAEAVVPLDQNKAWISAVAKDMSTAGIGGNSEQVDKIINLLQTLVDILPETMLDAFASMKFDINNREFARLVKAVN